MNDINGNVSTCNSTNLFFIKNNQVITSTGNYCLNGITRQKTIELCRENNIDCVQSNFKYLEIEDTDEAFVTGTFAGIIPVNFLEKKKLKSLNKNSMTNIISKLYFEKINQYIDEKHY